MQRQTKSSTKKSTAAACTTTTAAAGSKELRRGGSTPAMLSALPGKVSKNQAPATMSSYGFRRSRDSETSVSPRFALPTAASLQRYRKNSPSTTPPTAHDSKDPTRDPEATPKGNSASPRKAPNTTTTAPWKGHRSLISPTGRFSALNPRRTPLSKLTSNRQVSSQQQNGLSMNVAATTKKLNITERPAARSSPLFNKKSPEQPKQVQVANPSPIVLLRAAASTPSPSTTGQTEKSVMASTPHPLPVESSEQQEHCCPDNSRIGISPPWGGDYTQQQQQGTTTKNSPSSSEEEQPSLSQPDPSPIVLPRAAASTPSSSTTIAQTEKSVIVSTPLPAEPSQQQEHCCPDSSRLGISPPWGGDQTQQQQQGTVTKSSPICNEEEQPSLSQPDALIHNNDTSALIHHNDTSPGVMSSIFGLFSTSIWQPQLDHDDDTSEDESRATIPESIYVDPMSTNSLSATSQLSEDSLCSSSYSSSLTSSSISSLSSLESPAVQSHTISAQKRNLLQHSEEEDSDNDDDGKSQEIFFHSVFPYPAGLGMIGRILGDVSPPKDKKDESSGGSTISSSLGGEGQRPNQPVCDKSAHTVIRATTQEPNSRPQIIIDPLLVGCLESDAEETTDRASYCYESDDATADLFEDAAMYQQIDHAEAAMLQQMDYAMSQDRDDADVSSVESMSPNTKGHDSDDHEYTPAIDEAMQLFCCPHHDLLSFGDWINQHDEEDLRQRPRRGTDDRMLLLPTPSLRDELELAKKEGGEEESALSPSTTTAASNEYHDGEESRDDESPAPLDNGDNSVLTPQAATSHNTVPSQFEWVLSPVEVVSRERRRGLSNSGLLLQIPSPREEAHQAIERSNPTPKADLDESPDDDDSVQDDEMVPAQAIPITSSPSGDVHQSFVGIVEQVKGKTVLSSISETHEGLRPEDEIKELRSQVSRMLEEKRVTAASNEYQYGEKRCDDESPAPLDNGDNSVLTPQAATSHSTLPSRFEWVLSPVEVVSRERRRGLSKSGLLLQIPSPREETQEANERSNPTPKADLDESPDDDDSVQDDEMVPAHAIPITSSPSGDVHQSFVRIVEQVKGKGKTVLSSISETHVGLPPEDEIQELRSQVSRLLEEKGVLEDRLAKSRKADEERLTPFRNVFEEMRQLRAENEQYKRELKKKNDIIEANGRDLAMIYLQLQTQ